MERWKNSKKSLESDTIHFACTKESKEDLITTVYLQDTADQAGFKTKFIYIEDIGWNEDNLEFRDLDEEPIKNIFKLYAWEWIAMDEFGKNILRDKHQAVWIEALWKMILSNKAILPILWKLFPDHKNLFPSYFAGKPHDMKNYVSKPILSREGANIEIIKEGESVIKTEGAYGEGVYIHQQLHELPNFDGNYPVLGLWIIGGESGGMGIREDNTLVTGNMSRFVPHLINE